METTSAARRVRGALDFLEDLCAAARECAETEAMSDEIAARRRLRLLLTPATRSARGTEVAAG